ncbi:hypothetical protein AciPR4_3399 [Terriglobus saanensis SP1PR4]|uniref:Uncharacterized protein n=1 Tax=Terriglobus saanensis (strain ATCC BAA-1853 / DSM 23119 / SP1PR4) TaxID=401053 RepID=E8UXC9_TERSS|nr:hypothetical protein AciPR4_3399 [Terriglobus saanensis SP1PR4]
MVGYVLRILGKVVAGAVLLLALAYAVDWAVWRVHLSHGAGVATVTVDQVTVVALKGNKEEYYPDGSADVQCSRSMFPEGGDSPCWWLQRHRHVLVQE